MIIGDHATRALYRGTLEAELRASVTECAGSKLKQWQDLWLKDVTGAGEAACTWSPGIPTKCPHCFAELAGDPIPENMRSAYSPPYYWSRCIAVVDREKDRQTAWKCPDCEYEWEK